MRLFQEQHLWGQPAPPVTSRRYHQRWLREPVWVWVEGPFAGTVAFGVPRPAEKRHGSAARTSSGPNSALKDCCSFLIVCIYCDECKGNLLPAQSPEPNGAEVINGVFLAEKWEAFSATRLCSSMLRVVHGLWLVSAKMI